MKFISWTPDKISDIVELWNRELGDHFPMTESLFEQNSFLDENVNDDASQIALDEAGRVVGFIVAKNWQENLLVNMPEKIGWIQVLLVDSSYRSQQIGTTLLAHAESHLKSAGMEEVVLGRDPWHYFPGIPEEQTETAQWFERKGYTQLGHDYDLMQIYQDEDIIYPTVKNASFSVLQPQEEKALLTFLNKSFPGRWEYEAMHYFAKGGTGREFIVLKKAGHIIGFARINDYKSPLIAQNVYWSPLFSEPLGGIGPLGIDEEERKQGYGLAIVEAAIAELRARHIRHIVIDWTGLIDFYNRLGYNVWKGYQSYKKAL